MMHRILVDEKKWIDEPRFLHALNFCMLLPGPEAQKLATYIGWLLHGVRGGLAAGILFVLPGAFVMLGLSLLYALGRGVAAIDGALFGIKAAVLVIVVEALMRIGKRALKTEAADRAVRAWRSSAFSFLALPFPLIVGGRGADRLSSSRASRRRMLGLPARSKSSTHVRRATAGGSSHRRGHRARRCGGRRSRSPPLTLGPDHVLVTIGTFFSKLAVVSFGGAYAVLAYMAQQAVETHRWLTAPEMVDGLGLAETTPGPLILVTQFVGFLAAFRDAAPFSPIIAGVLGAAMTTWVTFVPSMLWIFAGAPFIEQLRANRRLSGALAAITAAVVGVILNLSVWFALHVLFGQVRSGTLGWLRWYAFDPLALDLKATALAVIAAVLAFGLHRGLIEVVAVMAALGIAMRLDAGRLARQPVALAKQLNWRDSSGLSVSTVANCRIGFRQCYRGSRGDTAMRGDETHVGPSHLCRADDHRRLHRRRHRRGGLEHVGRSDQPADLPGLLLRHAGDRLGDCGEDRRDG